MNTLTYIPIIKWSSSENKTKRIRTLNMLSFELLFVEAGCLHSITRWILEFPTTRKAAPLSSTTVRHMTTVRYWTSCVICLCLTAIETRQPWQLWQNLKKNEHCGVHIKHFFCRKKTSLRLKISSINTREIVQYKPHGKTWPYEFWFGFTNTRVTPNILDTKLRSLSPTVAKPTMWY